MSVEKEAAPVDEPKEEDQKDSSPEPTKASIPLEEEEPAPKDEALEEPDGGRQGTLFDAMPETKEADPGAARVLGDMPLVDRLRRSGVRGALVRLSHQIQGFQADPTQHYVRLVSWLRFSASLADQLPADVLEGLLRPLLAPAYRCSTAFRSSGKLPDIVTLDQALHLDAKRRREYLAELGQSFIDRAGERMKDARKSSEFGQVLSSVRKAVEARRSERVQKRRLQPVTDPEAAAAARRGKNRRRVQGKKRKLDELIQATKGGRGKHKVKQSKSLIS